MRNKSFKSLDEQVEILKSHGLRIDNEVEAKTFLMKNNYYRVSGYSLTLRKNDCFFYGTTFNNIVDIYNFDYELRHILLKYLEIIEVTLKSIYAYEFSYKYGPYGYLDVLNFTDENIYRTTIAKSEKQKERNLSNEAYLQHFKELNQPVPLWAYVDVLTLGNISKLYKITKVDVQKSVAAHYGLVLNTAHLTLGKFLHSMTILRNLCAHGSRLFNRLFEQKPFLSKQEKALLRKDSNGQQDNAHLFGFILLMKRLIAKKEFEAMKYEIISLSEKISFVDMKYYGFSDDWKSLI